jgi:hypothetical protein
MMWNRPRREIVLKYFAAALMIAGLLLLARTYGAAPGDKIVLVALGVAALVAALMIWADY